MLSLSTPSFHVFSCDVCYDVGHVTRNYLLLKKNSLSQLALICYMNMDKLTGEENPSNTQGGTYHRLGDFRGRVNGTLSSLDKNIMFSWTQIYVAPNQKHQSSGANGLVF